MTPRPTFLQTSGIFSILAIFLLSAGCISNPPNESHNPQSKLTARQLAIPIADAETFSAIVSQVVNENPLGCTAYSSGGQRHAPVEKVEEFYTFRLVYEDDKATLIGSNVNDFNTVSGFNTGLTTLMAHRSLAKSFNGTCILTRQRMPTNAALQCHDANSEIYSLVFGRDEIVLAGYSDDAIRARFETWVNTIPPLATSDGKPIATTWHSRDLIFNHH